MSRPILQRKKLRLRQVKALARVPLEFQPGVRTAGVHTLTIFTTQPELAVGGRRALEPKALVDTASAQATLRVWPGQPERLILPPRISQIEMKVRSLTEH